MKLDKEFGLSSWSINNKSTVSIIILIILIGGFFSYFSMPRESFPEVQDSKIYVSSIYPGSSAVDVENFVTKPLEEEIENISGIKDINSTSLQDYSLITVDFDDDITPEVAKQRVKDKVDMVKGKSDWPTLDGGAKIDPKVFDMVLSEMFPIMNINLRGNYSPQTLKEYAEEIQTLIESLPEIKEVDIRGVEEKEVEVAVDVYRATAASVSIGEIVRAIQRENVTISGGDIIDNDQRRNLRVVGQIKSPTELNDIVIKNNGGVVYLGDIATISFKGKDRTSYAREYGDPVVMLDVKKKSGKNQLDAADKIYRIMDNAKREMLPNDITVTITSDMSTRTKAQVASLENNVIFGILLVVSVLMFFLGSRNALFVGLAIPLSMLLSFMILSTMGITINTMVLFALVMGLGMLVDNGIVVVENVYRLMDEEKMSRIDAAKQGLGEVAWPIIASTATTLAAFAPLAFWPGLMGQFMKYFPITISIVLGSSLFVALIINSMLTSVLMKTEEESLSLKKLLIISGTLLILGAFFIWTGFNNSSKGFIGIGNVFIFISIVLVLHKYIFSHIAYWFQYTMLPKLENLYERFLTFALKGKRAYLFFFGTIGLLFFSGIIFSITQPKVLFFPQNEPNQAIVYIEYPEGTDIEKTRKITQEVENRVINIMKAYDTQLQDGTLYNFMAESIISQVGAGAGNPQVEGGAHGDSPNKGKVTVLFREYKYRRNISSGKVLTDIRNALKGYSGVSIIVEKDQQGPPTGYPINMEIKGDNYNELLIVAKDITNYINDENIPGIEELKININQNKPERKIIVDRKKAGRLGISTAQIGSALREAIYGYDASTYKGLKDDFDIIVRFNKSTRYNMSALMNQELLYRNTKGVLSKIPIAAVTTIKDVSTFNSIKRKNLKRVITVYSNVLEGYNANEIVHNLKNKLINYNLPKGISYEFTGEQEKMKENMAFLTKALLIALALITLIIVGQFNSINKPLIIMMAVMLSFIGVFLGLIISGDDFVIMMTMMGIISLAGIVVNNGIVLIDYTQLLVNRRKEELGIPKENLLEKKEYYHLITQGGKSRLRPVLLTAITTILGLIPLAIGLNIDFFAFFTEYKTTIYLGGDNTIFWGPLAWTIIYGLTFATFLTLIIVPVMFYLLNRAKIRLREKKVIKTTEA